MSAAVSRRLAALEGRRPRPERYTGAVVIAAPDGSAAPWIGVRNRAGRVVFALPHNGRDQLPEPRT